MELKPDSSWEANYKLDEANRRYYQADSSQPRFTSHDLSHYIAAHLEEFFQLKEFCGTGIFILETSEIYDISINLLSVLKKRIPVGIMMYVKKLPKSDLIGWKYETFTLPRNNLPDMAECVTLGYLIDSPPSLRFIMGD